MFIAVYTAYFREKEPEQKAKLLELANEKTPWFLAKFEKQVQDNGGFAVGGKVYTFYYTRLYVSFLAIGISSIRDRRQMTWADVHFSAIIELISNIGQKEFIKDYPALQKLNETVRSSPKIKAYLDKRPKTQF